MLMAEDEGLPRIIDVHSPYSASGSSYDAYLREQVMEGLSKPPGEKTLPSMLLYDQHGLRLYDTLTTECPGYYLFPAEEAILKTKADDIVQLMCTRGAGPGDGGSESVVLLELGAGALRKTSHILVAFSKLFHKEDRTRDNQVGCSGFPVTYYALDLERSELERTLRLLVSSHSELKGVVEANGMWGTYEDGIRFVKGGGLEREWGRARPSSQVQSARISVNGVRGAQANSKIERSSSSSSLSGSNLQGTSPASTHRPTSNTPRPLHLLFLGSSLGNFTRESSVSFLRSLPLRRGPQSGDTILLGLDHANPKDMVERAYNDATGHIRDFVLNGLRVAGRTLGDEELFGRGVWAYSNRYNECERLGRHNAYCKSTVDQTFAVPNTEIVFSLEADEEVDMAVSHKYSDEDAYSLFAASDLRAIMRWRDPYNRYSLWLLERPEIGSLPLEFPQGPHPLLARF